MILFQCEALHVNYCDAFKYLAMGQGFFTPEISKRIGSVLWWCYDVNEGYDVMKSRSVLATLKSAGITVTPVSNWQKCHYMKQGSTLSTSFFTLSNLALPSSVRYESAPPRKLLRPPRVQADFLWQPLLTVQGRPMHLLFLLLSHPLPGDPQATVSHCQVTPIMNCLLWHLGGIPLESILIFL